MRFHSKKAGVQKRLPSRCDRAEVLSVPLEKMSNALNQNNVSSSRDEQARLLGEERWANTDQVRRFGGQTTHHIKAIAMNEPYWQCCAVLFAAKSRMMPSKSTSLCRFT